MLIEIVKLLVCNGADLNVRGNGQETPLHVACDEQKLGIIRFLVQNGAATDLQDAREDSDDNNNDVIWNETALDKAIASKRLDMIAYLLAHRASLHTHNLEAYPEIQQVLLGDIPAMLEQLTQTQALQIVLGGVHPEAAITYLDRNDVTLQDPHTLFVDAITTGNMAFARYLLDKGYISSHDCIDLFEQLAGFVDARHAYNLVNLAEKQMCEDRTH